MVGFLLEVIGSEKSQVLRSKVEGQWKRGKHSEALNFKHEIRNEECEEAAVFLAIFQYRSKSKDQSFNGPLRRTVPAYRTLLPF